MTTAQPVPLTDYERIDPAAFIAANREALDSLQCMMWDDSPLPIEQAWHIVGSVRLVRAVEDIAESLAVLANRPGMLSQRDTS